MPTQRNYWMLVSLAENFERSRARNFDLAGMKSRHRRRAEDVQPGDKVVYYLTKVMAFGGAAEATGEYFEDAKTKIWESGKPYENYPYRFPIKPEVILDEGDYLPVRDIVHGLTYTRKWPKQHWRLAFQGNVHRLPAEDYRFIVQKLRAIKRRTAK